jgi:integrase/recombinase XerD
MGHFLHWIKSKSSLFGSTPQNSVRHSSPLHDWQGNRKYLTISERRAFVLTAERLSDEERTFCLTLAYTGARISEALALTPGRIDLEAELVIIESLKKRRRGIFRAIPLPTSFLEEIDRIHNVRRRQRNPEGMHETLWTFGRTTAWKLVHRVMDAAAIIGPHTSPKALRHAFAISALQAGVPITLVKKWLGHSRISTTEIYADAVGEEERSFAMRLWNS